MSTPIRVTINKEGYELSPAPYRSLLDVLRNDVALTGTKKGCDVGDCGACTVILDGKPVCACLVLAAEVDGCEILTIEGIQRGPGQLHPLQDNMMKYGGAQCGFCTPGIIVMAKALLDENPDPTEDDIRFGIAGNICRCTGYTKIIEAIQATAREMAAAREPVSPLPSPLWGGSLAEGERGGGPSDSLAATPTPNPFPTSGRSRPSSTGYGGGEQAARAAGELSATHVLAKTGSR